MAYRADIDGLRAVAILLVVIYHAFPSAIPGGFVGVDVFFVISGYLISTLIWNDIEAGRFSYLDFYARRARRIFPALGVMLAVTLAVGYFLLLPIEYEQLGKHTAGGSAFVQNFVLRSEAGYFDTASTTKPLLHLWSLAIEEQFYLLLPLLLVLVNARRLSPPTVIVSLAVLSFVYGLERAHAEPERSFFNPLVRFWEMLAGSLIAALQRPKMSRWIESIEQNWAIAHLAKSAGIVGIALILFSAASFTKLDTYPSWRAIVPVLGAMLVISSGTRSSVTTRLLSVRLLTGLGLISYSLYLWHWPLITYAHILHQGEATWDARACAVILSVLCAGLTYRLVETPFRALKPLSRAAMGSVGVMVMCGSAGLLVAATNGLPGRDAKVDLVARSMGSWEFPGDMSQWEDQADRRIFRALPSAPKVTLFLGDSNIQQYYSRVDELIKHGASQTRGAIFITGGGCAPIPGVKHLPAYDYCQGMAEAALNEIRTNSRIDRVVIGASWNSYLAHGLRVEGEWGRGAREYEGALTQLFVVMSNMKQQGLEVFFVLNAPSGPELDPRSAILRDLRAFPDVLKVMPKSIDRTDFEAKYAPIQSDLRDVASRAGAKILDPADHLCSERCNALSGEGLPIYKDAGHLNPLYVRQHATFLDPVMSETISTLD